ncbi:MAG TPA: septum formation family protein [Nocardioides sp.]
MLAAGFALAAATTLAACGDDDAPSRDESTNEITESGTAEAASLEVGDCVNNPDSDQFEDIGAVPCADSHDLEIYHAFDLADGEYPAEEDIFAEAETECGGRFEEFVGFPYEDSEIDWDIFFPTSQSWDEFDDREVQCIVFDLNGPVEGTLEGAGR